MPPVSDAATALARRGRTRPVHDDGDADQTDGFQALIPTAGTRVDDHKRVVQRLVDEVMNGRDFDVLDELYTPELAALAREWTAPFRESFPDVRMEVVQLVAEDNTVAAVFLCCGTQLGPWRGHDPAGRRSGWTRSTSSSSPTGASHVHGVSKTRTSASS